MLDGKAASRCMTSTEADSTGLQHTLPCATTSYHWIYTFKFLSVSPETFYLDDIYVWWCVLSDKNICSGTHTGWQNMSIP